MRHRTAVFVLLWIGATSCALILAWQGVDLVSAHSPDSTLYLPRYSTAQTFVANSSRDPVSKQTKVNSDSRIIGAITSDKFEPSGATLGTKPSPPIQSVVGPPSPKSNSTTKTTTSNLTVGKVVTQVPPVIPPSPNQTGKTKLAHIKSIQLTTKLSVTPPTADSSPTSALVTIGVATLKITLGIGGLGT